VITDVHVHIAGTDGPRHGNYLSPALRRRPLFRLLALRLGIAAFPGARAEPPDARVRRRVLGWLRASRVDEAVFLALDGVYRPDGAFDAARTHLVTGNAYVAALAAECARVRFGASIHPYRRDALAELDRAVAGGACLVKWLPAAQGIDLAAPLCRPFYRALAAHGLPLLCHTGREHTLPVGGAPDDDPAALRPALDAGVTVIAAHCGAPLSRREPGFFPTWAALARQYDRFYGDLGAFLLPARVRLLRRLLADATLASRLVYGSDFPAMAWPGCVLPHVTPRAALRLLCTRNPFDRPVVALQALGVPDAVFARGGTLLRAATRGARAGEAPPCPT
jgi:uncharacterized protein